MIYSIFHTNVIATPRKDAIILSNGQRHSYEEIHQYVLRLSTFLFESGVRENDHIGVLLDNEDWHVLTLLALNSLGACYVPFDTDIPKAQFEKDCQCLSLKTIILDNRALQENFNICRTKSLFIEAKIDCSSAYQTYNNISIIQNPENICYLVSSSGTTSDKKWIPILGKGLLYWANVITHQVGLTNRDKTLVTRSPAFDARIFEYLLACASGGALVLIDHIARRDFASIKHICEKENISVMLFIASLLTSSTGLALVSSLKQYGMAHLFVTGDACSLDLKNVCKSSDIKLWDAYGSTEETFGMSLSNLNDYEPPSTLQAHHQLPITKPYGSEVRYYLVDSKLYIDSPYLAPYYITTQGQQPVKKSIELDNGESVNVFDTGDAFEEHDGHLFYLGRYNDASHCKIDGVKVTSHRIKHCLLEFNALSHDALIDVEVVLKNHHGKIAPFAYVVLPNKFNTSLLNSYAKSRLSKEEIPFFISVKCLPRLLNSDKIDLRALIEREDDIDAWFSEPQTVPLEADSSEKKIVRQIWQTVLGRKVIPDDIDFMLLGGTSLNSMEMISLIKSKLNSTYDHLDLFRLKEITVNSIVESLSSSKSVTQDAALITKLHQSNTSSENLFFLPALLGEGKFSYKLLSSSMINYPKYFNQTMYGLSEPGLYDETVLSLNFEHAITRYISAIKRIQPTGPYRLIGFSFGATLAYGVAKAIEAAGESVVALHLLDGLPPSLYQRLDNTSHYSFLKALLNFLISMLNNHYYGESLKPFDIINGQTYSPRKQVKAAFTCLKKETVHPQSIRMLNVAKMHLKFMRSISPVLMHEKLRVMPTLYFTQQNQHYLNVINSLNVSMHSVSYKTYCWNEYFHQLKLNMQVPYCHHLELVSKKYHADRYWQPGYYTAFDFQFDTYGPKARYQLNPKDDNVELSLFFLTYANALWIENYLSQQGALPEVLSFYKQYTLSIEKKTFFIQLTALFCSLPLAKVSQIEQLMKRIGLESLAESTEKPAMEHHPTPEFFLVLPSSGFIELHLGCYKLAIELVFTFQVDINLSTLCQTLLTEPGSELISIKDTNRVQFFHALKTPAIRDSVNLASDFIATFIQTIHTHLGTCTK